MENLHPLIQYFTNQGVPLETTQFIMMLIIIATLIAFFRQVVGIKAFGIYAPLIVTLAFLGMGTGGVGVKYGIFIFITIIFVGMITRYALKKLRLLYLPRVAITLSVVSLAILAVLTLGGSMQRTGLASVSIFPLLIMIAIVEKFVAAQIEKGTKKAIILAVETLAISIIGYYLASWDAFVDLLLKYPWLILVAIVFNVILGKWSGLRLSEYHRFRKVLKKL